MISSSLIKYLNSIKTFEKINIYSGTLVHHLGTISQIIITYALHIRKSKNVHQYIVFILKTETEEKCKYN